MKYPDMGIHQRARALRGLGSEALSGVRERAAASFLVRVSSNLLALLSGVLLARLLGAAGYGIYSYAFAVVAVLAIPAQLGLPTLIVREVATLRAREEWPLMRGLLRRGNEMVVLSSLLIIIVAGVVGWRLKNAHNSQQIAAFMWAIALLPLMALGMLRSAALRGLHLVVRGQLPDQVIRPGLLVVGLLTAAWIVRPDRVTAVQAMQIHVLSAGLAYIVGAWMLLRALPSEVRARRAEYQTKSWLASMVPLSILMGAQVIINQTDIIVIGLFFPDRQVGIYRAALQASLLVGFTGVSTAAVMAPHIASMYARAQKSELQMLITSCSRGVFTTALVPGLILIAFNRAVLTRVFGEAYAPGAVSLAVLCAGQVFGAACGPVGLIMNMTGKERQALPIVVFAAALNAALDFILVPKIGIEGAAVATAISFAFWNAALAWQVHARLHIVSVPFVRPRAHGR